MVAACTTVNAPGGFPTLFPPDAATQEGREIAALYAFTFWIAVVVFVLVEGLILWNVFRYRRRKDDSLPHQTHGHLIAEIIWTAVPAAIVLVLFVLSMQTLAKVEARSESPPAVVVDAFGFQWQWAFGYDCPEAFERSFTKIDESGQSFTGAGNQGPEMVLPTNQRVRIRLHGTDVNHAFYVPQFLYKQDVIPGQVNSFELLIDRAGTYTGQCAEFCGLAHASMNFTVRAVDRAAFDTWKEQAEEEAAASPTPVASGVAEESPGGGQAGPAVDLSASNVQSFDQQSAEAPAGKPFEIQFTNNDPTAPHNVAIRQATPEGDFIGMPIADPGTQQSYRAPALAAGEYTFYCSVHPNMEGTLTVR